MKTYIQKNNNYLIFKIDIKIFEIKTVNNF